MKLKKSYIGIDPGAKGGVSLVHEGRLISSNHCPDTVVKMNKLINDICEPSDDISNWTIADKIECYIENVWAFPTDMRSSAFKFGKNFGMWLGVLAGNHINTTLVSPQVWQKYYGELPKVKKDRKVDKAMVCNVLV